MLVCNDRIEEVFAENPSDKEPALRTCRDITERWSHNFKAEFEEHKSSISTQKDAQCPTGMEIKCRRCHFVFYFNLCFSTATENNNNKSDITKNNSKEPETSCTAAEVQT